jgi:hypothetical protein
MSAFAPCNGKSFADVYGTGSKKNAFGKCVSSKADAATVADEIRVQSATVQGGAHVARRQRVRHQVRHQRQKTRFGKCVSKLAKAQPGKTG